MLPFYYVRTLEKIEICLLDMFSDIRVNKYNDITRKTYSKTVNVPVYTHIDKNFANHWRNRTKAKMPMPIPCAGLRFKSITPNTANRTQTTYARSTWSNSSKQWIQDIQPTPYFVTYDLEFLTDNRGDWGQIVENILPYFNPYRTMRLKEFDFFNDIENKVPVLLEGIDVKFEDEIDVNSKQHRFIRFTVSLKVHVDLYRPFEIPEIIKYAELNVSVDKFIDKHQVFVYPDPIAEKEKKEWEVLTPSSREGFSLLKTIAGTLVKEVELDGSTHWKNITIPDALRPAQVPNYKQMSFNFDLNSPNEIDRSGYGRDFIALNDSNRTYIPDLPPGAGQDAPDGYKPTLDTWNNILDWFGTSDGLNESPLTYDIILQFNDLTPKDTIFQTLHNKETKNYLNTGHTLPENEVFYEWGLLGGQLYFSLRTVKFDETELDFVEVLNYTFMSENKLQLNNSNIYKFSFVLYNKGHDGIFGYMLNNTEPMIALPTVRD